MMESKVLDVLADRVLSLGSYDAAQDQVADAIAGGLTPVRGPAARVLYVQP